MEEDFSTLDVGCGVKFKGRVNLDKHKNVNPETSTPFYPMKNIPNLVVGDALHLPFRASIFKKVFCHHVIEHVKSPHVLVGELKRVVDRKGVIQIKCPHRFSKNARNPFHIHYFTVTWFNRIFKKNGFHVDVTLTYWYPIAFIGFRLPDEITVKIKNKLFFRPENH